MKPTLSIITPVKNAAPWIAACLQSCLDQNFTDWEWIFVDDHSEDATLKILTAFAENDQRILVYANPGKGIIEALQKGLAESQGELITRMDADDIMPEDRLDRMVEAVHSSPHRTVVTGLVEYFSEDVVSEGYLGYQQWINAVARENAHWENIYRECVVASPNWMMRTEELKGIGGFRNLEYPEDYDLVFRWYQNGFTIQAISEITLYWREHSTRISRNSENYAQQKFFHLKLNRFFQLDFKQAKNLILWGTGRKARLTTQLLSSRNIRFSWMDLRPERYPAGIDEHSIIDFKNIENVDSPQLLIAIHPPEGEMEKLKNYLHALNLDLGKDYWFL